jgi:hypothetical protein
MIPSEYIIEISNGTQQVQYSTTQLPWNTKNNQIDTLNYQNSQTDTLKYQNNQKNIIRYLKIPKLPFILEGKSAKKQGKESGSKEEEEETKAAKETESADYSYDYVYGYDYSDGKMDLFDYI